MDMNRFKESSFYTLIEQAYQLCFCATLSVVCCRHGAELIKIKNYIE